MLSGTRDVLDGAARERRGIRSGQLLFFRRGTVHSIPTIAEAPVVFLSVDTPRRDPRDIIFVNPEERAHRKPSFALKDRLRAPAAAAGGASQQAKERSSDS